MFITEKKLSFCSRRDFRVSSCVLFRVRLAPVIPSGVDRVVVLFSGQHCVGDYPVVPLKQRKRVNLGTTRLYRLG